MNGLTRDEGRPPRPIAQPLHDFDSDLATAIVRIRELNGGAVTDRPISQRLEYVRPIERVLLRNHRNSGRKRVMDELERYYGAAPKKYVINHRLGRLVGLSPNQVRDARRIVDTIADDPRLMPLLEKMDASGQVPTNETIARVQAGVAGGDEPVALITRHDRRRAETARMRVVRLIAGIEGYRKGLKELEVPRAVAATDDEEVRQWITALNKAIPALSKLRTQLQNGRKAQHGDG